MFWSIQCRDPFCSADLFSYRCRLVNFWGILCLLFRSSEIICIQNHAPSCQFLQEQILSVHNLHSFETIWTEVSSNKYASSKRIEVCILIMVIPLLWTQKKYLPSIAITAEVGGYCKSVSLSWGNANLLCSCWEWHSSNSKGVSVTAKYFNRLWIIQI